MQPKLRENKECSAKYKQICIRRKVALIPGLCKVDYGGPVLTELNTNEYKALGILTRATQGCGSDVIFTSIAQHRNWIKSTASDVSHSSQPNIRWFRQLAENAPYKENFNTWPPSDGPDSVEELVIYVEEV
uniref:Peptidase S1 domain-containing protein n=1 Tax=Anopheles culicifacies TaxID=139723 RepID=A0A182MVM1_9DIPT